jgi:uncharacterized protein
MKNDESAATRRADEAATELDSVEVADYLRRHPDFFLRNEETLAELQLPHRAGSAVSLVERQVALLRERNIDSRHRLNRLLETAQDNDRLFAKTRQLILTLLEAQSQPALTATVIESVRREFGADFCALLLIVDAPGDAPDGATVITRDVATGGLQSLLRPGKPVVGPLRPREKELIFGAHADQVQSAALIPLGAEQPFALLAIGSSDVKRFHPDMGTLFLGFIGAIVERLMPRLPRN